MATVTAHAQEPFLQPATLRVGIKLFLHVVGQRPTFPCTQFTEIRIVLLDKAIQQRGLWSMPRVARWIDERRSARISAPYSQQRQRLGRHPQVVELIHRVQREGHGAAVPDRDQDLPLKFVGIGVLVLVMFRRARSLAQRLPPEDRPWT